MSRPISRRLGPKHPEPIWRKPIHAHVFSNEIGNDELHNPGYYSERFQFVSGSNWRNENMIQSKRHRHPLSKIRILCNVPIFLIMLSGRWSSDSFLNYIRKKVTEFSKGVSSIMTKKNLFHTLPDTRSSSFGTRTKNTDHFTTKLSVPVIDELGKISAMQPSFALQFWGLWQISMMYIISSGVEAIQQDYYLCFYLLREHLIVSLFILLFILISFMIMYVLCLNSSSLLVTQM